MYYSFRYKLNVWDVGGQKSLRSYWRNYFESTDGLIWVVDSADKRRLDDCRKELHALLQEEVCSLCKIIMQFLRISRTNIICSNLWGPSLDLN
jgi:GTPase SAR1 family protein